MSEVFMYTDGSSRGNPGPGGWGSVVVEGDSVIEYGGRKEQTTNNEMELTAVIISLKNLTTKEKIKVYSDSSYVINGITKWIFSWQKNDWRTSTGESVVNQELWKELLSESSKFDIEWVKVAGHKGVSGNERADIIATSFADNSPVDLYNGSLKNYTFLSTDTSFSKDMYISIIDGQVEEHTNWDDCRNRVEGISGAKYKKVKTEKEKEDFINKNLK